MKYSRVLLICIDSLGRPYQKLFAPYFNLRFGNYRASQTWTLPAHVAMLSGVYLPELYHVFDTRKLSLWKNYVRKIKTMGVEFRRFGFQTRAVVGGGYLSKFFGWGSDWSSWQTPEEGFAEWNGEPRLPAKNEFLFLHTYYAHNWFSETPQLSAWFKKNDRAYDLKHKYDLSLMAQAQKVYEKRLRILARRLAWLKTVPQDTLIILTSDHAEVFSQNGRSFHHGDMARENPEVFAVPLFMRTAGKKQREDDSDYLDLALPYLIKKELGLAER